MYLHEKFFVLSKTDKAWRVYDRDSGRLLCSDYRKTTHNKTLDKKRFCGLVEVKTVNGENYYRVTVS